MGPMANDPSHLSNVTGFSRAPARPGDGPGDAMRLRRIAYAGLAMLASALAGLALVRVPPLLVIAGVCCVLFIVVIFARPFIGLLLYTALFFFRPGEIFPVLQALPLERVVGVLTLIGMYLEQFRASRRLVIDGSKQTRLILLLTIMVIISVPVAYWRSGAVSGLVEFLKILIFYLLIVHLVGTRSRLRMFVFLYIGSIAYIGADSFSSYLQGSLKVAQGIERVVGQTSAGGDPNTLATTLVSAFPFFLLLVSQRPMGWRRVPLILGGILLLLTIAVTGSRGGVLALIASLGVLWWSARQKILFGIIALIFLVGSFWMLPEQYKTRYATIGDTELDDSSLGRLSAWKVGARMMTDRPLTGVGINCFSSARAGAYSPEFKRSGLQPHNVYVQVPAEIGLIGAFVFYALLLEFVRLNRKTAVLLGKSEGDWRFERAVVQALFVGLVALLVAGMFGHSFLRRTWYIYGAIGLSVFRIYSDRDVQIPQRAKLSLSSPIRRGTFK